MGAHVCMLLRVAPVCIDGVCGIKCGAHAIGCYLCVPGWLCVLCAGSVCVSVCVL